MRPTASVIALLALLAGALPVAAAPKVVASIKPVHSIVAAVMDGVGEPELLVGGNASAHSFQLKPSQAAALQEADIVFRIGPGLEAWLDKPIANLASASRVVDLAETKGLTLLSLRKGGSFEAHKHEEAHDDHGHDDGHDHGGESGIDQHVWLDTGNAKVIAGAIAETLSAADPENAARYAANLAAFETRTDALAAEIAATIAPVKDRPVIVFHDAYQYFERQFGIAVVGSVAVNPEVQPGAERLAEIRDKVRSLKAACIFAEPQFEPKIVTMLAEGTGAGTGTLDPEAGSMTEGPDLYPDMMRSLAENLAACRPM